MKRYGLLILALVVVASMASMMMLSCGAEEPKVEAQTWRLQHHYAAGSDEDKEYQAFAEGVTKDTNGMITVESYPAFGLGYQKEDVAAAVQAGTLELAALSFGWIEGSNPLVGVTHLPGLATTKEGLVKATAAVAPYIDKEMGKRDMTNLIYFRNANGQLVCKKPVPTIEDWKGLKLRAQGATQEWYFAKLGATPVSMAMAEMYPSLAQGTIDGVYYSPSSSISQKLYEVCGYYNIWDQPSVSFGLLIQKDRLESLPEDLQDALLNNANILEKGLWNVVFYSADEYTKRLEEYGMEIVEVSISEKERLSDIAKGYWDIWLEKTGPDGLAALNAALTAGGLPAYK